VDDGTGTLAPGPPALVSVGRKGMGLWSKPRATAPVGSTVLDGVDVFEPELSGVTVKNDAPGNEVIGGEYNGGW